jgi:hypothetical protein
VTLQEFGDIVNGLGTVGLLIVIIYGGMKGWYVWRREHEAVTKDRDFWRRIALQGITAAEKSLDIQTEAKEPLA